MRLVLNLWIPGNPKTKGSLEDRGNGALTDTPASKRWRALMRDRMKVSIIGEPVGPTKAAKVDRFWFISRPPTPIGREINPMRGHLGDVDKLDRNLFDAMTDALVWRDDEQLADGSHRKRWASDLGPGVLVQLWELDEADL